jgi:hypothetical protein
MLSLPTTAAHLVAERFRAVCGPGKLADVDASAAGLKVGLDVPLQQTHQALLLLRRDSGNGDYTRSSHGP